MTIDINTLPIDIQCRLRNTPAWDCFVTYVKNQLWQETELNEDEIVTVLGVLNWLKEQYDATTSA